MKKQAVEVSDEQNDSDFSVIDSKGGTNGWIKQYVKFRLLNKSLYYFYQL